MMPHARWLLGLLSGVLLTSWPSAGSAAENVTFDVTMTAPAGCPDAGRFIGQVLGRTRRALQSDVSPDFRFALTIIVGPEASAGELVIRSADGDVTTRRVPADDCASVVEASALIATLILDPNALSGPLPTSDTPSREELRKFESRNNEDTASASARNGERVGSQDEHPAYIDRQQAVTPMSASADRLIFGVDAAPLIESAIAPGVTPGFSIGARLGEDRTDLVSPVVGIDAEYAASDATETKLGSASFTWFAARTWLCPLRWPAAPESFGALPCVFFDAGVLRGTGDNTYDARVQTMPWFSAGAFGRLEWRATSAFSFELQGGAGFPLFRDRFVFLPDVVAHEIPPVALFASAGVSIWFR